MPKPHSIQAKDLFHLTGYTAIAGVKAVKTATIVPFKGRHRHGDKPYVRKVLYEIINSYMIGISVREVQLIHPSTSTSYRIFCTLKGLKQRVNHLPNNTTAYWLNYNEKTKKNVLVWFHGGGYVLACTDGHIRFLYSDLMRKTGGKYAVVILAYTLAPERQYPTQLIQAATLVNYLISQEGIQPRDIVIGGDSAGGNLALGLLGHATHPHPACPRLIMREGEMFRASLLMSPWVTFDSNSPSMTSNELKDYICRRSLRKWHEAFMGTARLDAYNTPLDAPVEWWQGVAVKSILFTGGGDELFRSDIEALGAKIQTVHPNTKVMIVPGDVHDQPFIDRILYMKTGKQCKNIVSWLSTLEIPGFESDRQMDFSHNLSINSYRTLSSYQQQPQKNRLQKIKMSASIAPLESPCEIPEGKLDHLNPSAPIDPRRNGRLPSFNVSTPGVDLGNNKVDSVEDDPAELRDNRVNWQHPPTMEVLHARHRQNSDPKPVTPQDYARLHREENERYLRQYREKQEEQRLDLDAKKRESDRRIKARNSPPRHQLHDKPAAPLKTNGYTHTFSYEQDSIDPQYIPMPASPPRSDEGRPAALDRHHDQAPKVEISGLHQGSPLLKSSNYSATSGQDQLYDFGTLGGQPTPQASCRSVRSRHGSGSTDSHKSIPSPHTNNSNLTHERSSSSESEATKIQGRIGSDGYANELVSPLDRNETPEVHVARVEHLARARWDDAKEWHDLDGRRF